MFRNGLATLGIRQRDLLLMLTLVSHLLGTFGFPLLAPGSISKDASCPYPCLNHPCGCRSAEECWAGDCCCFTLEEKLAWAETNNIEPPDHVRPLVESRKAHSDPPKKKSSCCEAEILGQCCETKAPEKRDTSGLRWVVGMFAQKCHGEKPAGLMKLNPCVAPDMASHQLAATQSGEFLARFHPILSSTSHAPPIPPPR